MIVLDLEIGDCGGFASFFFSLNLSSFFYFLVLSPSLFVECILIVCDLFLL